MIKILTSFTYGCDNVGRLYVFVQELGIQDIEEISMKSKWVSRFLSDHMRQLSVIFEIGV